MKSNSPALTGPLHGPYYGVWKAKSKENHHYSGLSCLLHNHPSGDPMRSRADVQMTRQIVDIARPLGIAVHDHIIVGKDGHASLKGMKLI